MVQLVEMLLKLHCHFSRALIGLWIAPPERWRRWQQMRCHNRHRVPAFGCCVLLISRSWICLWQYFCWWLWVTERQDTNSFFTGVRWKGFVEFIQLCLQTQQFYIHYFLAFTQNVWVCWDWILICWSLTLLPASPGGWHLRYLSEQTEMTFRTRGHFLDTCA